MIWIEAQPTKFKCSFYILVDDDDFEYLDKFRWRVQRRSRNGTYYAYTILNNKGISMHRLIMNPNGDESVHHINQIGLHNFRKNLINLKFKDHLKEHHKNPFKKRTNIYRSPYRKRGKGRQFKVSKYKLYLDLTTFDLYFDKKHTKLAFPAKFSYNKGLPFNSSLPFKI